MDATLLVKAAVLGIIEGRRNSARLFDWPPHHLRRSAQLTRTTTTRSSRSSSAGGHPAVCWDYRAKIAEVVGGLGSDRNAQRSFNLIIPFAGGSVRLMFYEIIEGYLFNPLTVAGALSVGGSLILYIEAAITRAWKRVDEMGWKDALQVGFAHIGPCSWRLLPGARIMRWVAFGCKAATESSFFPAIPTMLAATAYDVYKNWALLKMDDPPVFAVGFVFSFIAAMVAVKAFIRFVSGHSFAPFASVSHRLGGSVLLPADGLGELERRVISRHRKARLEWGFPHRPHSMILYLHGFRSALLLRPAACASSWKSGGWAASSGASRDGLGIRVDDHHRKADRPLRHATRSAASSAAATPPGWPKNTTLKARAGRPQRLSCVARALSRRADQHVQRRIIVLTAHPDEFRACRGQRISRPERYWLMVETGDRCWIAAAVENTRAPGRPARRRRPQLCRWDDYPGTGHRIRRGPLHEHSRFRRPSLQVQGARGFKPASPSTTTKALRCDRPAACAAGRCRLAVRRTGPRSASGPGLLARDAVGAGGR